jgi:hypothetical protein
MTRRKKRCFRCGRFTNVTVPDCADVLCDGCYWENEDEERRLEHSQRLGGHGVELEARDE